MADVDYFLRIDGIKGESLDAKGHAGEIELQSWSWGETNSGSFAQSAGGGAGKVVMQDFHFVMMSNTASPKLFQACASGEHIPSATLTCRKAGTTPQEFLIIKFTDLLISSYQTGGSNRKLDVEAVIPTDQISFNFATIEVDYKEQKADGSLGPAIHGGWDVKKHQKK
jgi:type VI secretion system secreted protein Hcp